MVASTEPYAIRLRGRWIGWRNRMIANPDFRRWASRFPPARPIARAHAGALFDLAAGFVYSQATAAFVESGLLDMLARGPMTPGEAADRASLSVEATLVLLRAAAALGLAESVGARFTLGARGAALAASPGIAEMIAHHRLLYADLADPLAMLRGEGPGRLAALWRYGEGDTDAVAAYSRLMAVSQPMVAEQALAAYRFARHRRLLDVGGGEGAFLEAVAAAVPALSCGLFDLPDVAARAAQRLGERAEIHGGDFLSDPIPAGYDLVTLVRVLHDHDDEAALRLLRAIHAALPAGGCLLIVEPMAGTPGAERSGHAYFGFYLAAMGSGRPRTPAEIMEMLTRCGFGSSRLLATPIPLIARAIIANK